MPSTSITQRRFMAICEHDPKHAQGKCPDMTQKQFHDFSSTKESGLPRYASQRRAATKRKTKAR